jgi:dihydrofolate reductase
VARGLPLRDAVAVLSEDVIMSKVILDISMSVDGLIAQPDDDPGPIQDFLFSGETEHDGMFRTSGATTEVFREFIDSAGAVITGRRTYDVTNGWEGNHPMRVPCFVVTHDVPTDVPDGPTQFSYVTDGIDSAVRQAKAVAGEKDVSIMGGASIARQALEAKLLDEIQIHLSPVILGNGIRLFDGLDTRQIRLEQLRVIEAPGVTHLRYAVHN